METQSTKESIKGIMQINTLNDLIPFGIEWLTSEACAFGLRILYDLNEEGVQYVRDFLSIKREGFQAPWNSSSSIGKHVASIMLGNGSFRDLAAFLLLKHHPYVITIPEEGAIAADTSEDWKHLKECYANRNYRQYVNAHNGQSRNCHAMSGRVE